MGKPTNAVLFATDATYAADGDTWSGDPPRVDPGAARRAEGFEPDLLPAEWLNYAIGAHGDHLDYVHGILEASGTIPATFTRTIILAGSQLQTALAATDYTDWSTEDGPGAIEIGTNFGRAPLNLQRILPHGATLTRVRVLVKPGAGRTGANRMQLRSATYAPNFTTPSISGASSDFFTAVLDDTTSGLQVLDSTALTQAISSLSVTSIQVRGGDNAATYPDTVYAIELQFTDPGPRNF